MDEDGNGIPDWLEEPDTSIGSSDDTVSSSSFDDSEEDFLISETDKKREVIDYPSWLTEEIGFMSDAGEQDLYHDEIATASEDILLPPTSPHVESFQEPETFEEPIVTTLKQALTKEKEPEVLKQEMHEDRPESVPESDHVIRASNDQ